MSHQPMPTRRWQATLGVLLVLFSLGFASLVSPIAQATAPVVAIKVTDDTGALVPPYPGFVFIDKTVDADYASGPALLSSTPDGAGSTVVDDEMLVDITRPDGSTVTVDHDYSGGCSGITYAVPVDISSMLQPGTNHLRFRMMDRCGGGAMSSSAMYLVLDAPPAPEPPPADSFGVKDVQISATNSDRILTRHIEFVPGDSSPLVRYEYAWAATPTGTTPGGTVQKCNVAKVTCLLNYGPVQPSSTHNLLARAVAKRGVTSPWFVKAVPVPPAFVLVVFGDSVSSGHHRDSEGAPTICQDETYSFGQTVWNELQSQVPAHWRLEHGYINVANSGFSTSKILNGGADACGDTHESELNLAVRMLTEHQGSWNRVIGDGGINDTNWGEVLTSIVGDAMSGKIKNGKQCQSYLARWNFTTDQGVHDQLAGNVQVIARSIVAADPLSARYWNGYYNVANTGTGAATIPSVCKSAISQALDSIHALLKQALADQGFGWVNTNSVLGSEDSLLQDIYPSDKIFGNSGWPHPNREGAIKVGTLVLRVRTP